MDKSLKIRFLILSLIYSAFTSNAEEQVIYKWVDSNNIAHFSQLKPNQEKFIEIPINSISKKIKQTDSLNTKQDEFGSAINSINKEYEKNTIEATMAKYCEKARKDIRTLIAFDDVKYTNAKGKVKFLSESEKKKKLILSEKKVAVYCKK